MSLGNTSAFLLVTVLTGALLWRGHFWAGLILLAVLCMALTLLSGMGQP